METLLAQTVDRSPGLRDDWSVAMRWRNLLFAHWPLRAETLRPLIPPELEIDTFDGWAWIGVVPFYLSIRYRWMPFGLSFPEVNVRTYVKHGEQSGVWFLSLDAESRLAVSVARRTYGLPYHAARMSVRKMPSEPSPLGRGPGEGAEYWPDALTPTLSQRAREQIAGVAGPRICFSSRRKSLNSPPAELHIEYKPIGNTFTAAAGSIDHWLIERYQLFTADHEGRIARGKIHHPPWQLQSAAADFQINRLVELLGISLPPEPPLLHFARETNAVAWKLKWCKRQLLMQSESRAEHRSVLNENRWTSSS